MFGILGIVIHSFFLKSKGADVLFVNALHTPWLDTAMKWITQLSEPAFVIVLLGLFTFIVNKNVLFWTVNLFLVTMVGQVLKVIFKAQRPINFINNTVGLHRVEGVEIFRQYSFPSGHTAAAFALACCISLHYRKWYIQLLCFVLALLVGISRMYLLQHFLLDVSVGALLGVFCTLYFSLLLQYARTFLTSIKRFRR